MSSHLFDEVDHTCERVGIIREGSIVTVENINSLKKTLPKSIVVALAHAEDIKVLQNNGLVYTELGPLRVDIRITDGYDQVLSVLSQCKVIDMECPPQTLEQIFMDFYGKEPN